MTFLVNGFRFNDKRMDLVNLCVNNLNIMTDMMENSYRRNRAYNQAPVAMCLIQSQANSTQ